MMTLEKEIEKTLCDSIEDSGGMAIKFSDPAKIGAPDRLVIEGIDSLTEAPTVYFVETKTPTGKLAPLQIVYANDLRARGVPVFLLDSFEKLGSFLRGDFIYEDYLLVNAGEGESK